MGHEEFYSWECCCDSCLDAQLAGSAQLVERMHDLKVTGRDLSLPLVVRLEAYASLKAVEGELLLGSRT